MGPGGSQGLEHTKTGRKSRTRRVSVPDIVCNTGAGVLRKSPGALGGAHVLDTHSRYSRERKLNTNFFFSNFSGTSGISRQNPGISRPKSLISLVFEGRIELFGPHPFTWKTPTPLENIRTKKFGFGFFFLPDIGIPPPPREKITK